MCPDSEWLLCPLQERLHSCIARPIAIRSRFPTVLVANCGRELEEEKSTGVQLLIQGGSLEE